MRSATARLMKGAATALLFIVVALCLAILIVPPFLDRIYYSGPRSGHYDGGRFFNPDGEDAARLPGGGSQGGFIARWVLGRDGRPAWPKAVAVTPSKPAARVAGQAMVATWVGHATMLIQTQGVNILTDPVWADVAGPLGLAGPRRVAPPGIRLADLPKIDLILVSHDHYDHMDLKTLKTLWDRDRPQIVTSLGNDSLIRNAGAQARALDWGGRITIRPGIDVVVTRNHHWGSRWGTDRNRALWSSFTVTLPGGNIFFAGDTGAGDLMWPGEAAAIGPVRFAILPIGAFRFQPGQMSTGSHIGPRQSVEVFERLGASFAAPIHWGTFRLSYEGYRTPPQMLALFLRCAGYAPDVFAERRIGVAFAVPPYTRPGPKTPWRNASCADGSPALQAME